MLKPLGLPNHQDMLKVDLLSVRGGWDESIRFRLRGGAMAQEGGQQQAASNK